MAPKLYPRVRLLIKYSDTDSGVVTVFGFEVPFLEAVWQTQHVSYFAPDPPKALPGTLAREYERLSDQYREQVGVLPPFSPDSPEAFQAFLDAGSEHIDRLAHRALVKERTAAARLTPEHSARHHHARETCSSLVAVASTRIAWLSGGTGRPSTAAARTAADSIEQHLRKGCIAIWRSETHADATRAFEDAKAKIRAVNLDALAPVFRQRGTTRNLPRGAEAKHLPASTAGDTPISAAVVDAWTEGDADAPAWIEHVLVEPSSAGPSPVSWRRVPAESAGDSIELLWLDAKPTSPVVVELRARNATAPSAARVLLPVPREPGADPPRG